MSRVLSLALWLCVACRRDDDCQRAADRLARVTSELVARGAAEQCRAGGTAAKDPVLRCALDNTTDRAAADCIEQFTKAVVHGAPSSGDGSGLNPLLSR